MDDAHSLIPVCILLVSVCCSSLLVKSWIVEIPPYNSYHVHWDHYGYIGYGFSDCFGSERSWWVKFSFKMLDWALQHIVSFYAVYSHFWCSSLQVAYPGACVFLVFRCRVRILHRFFRIFSSCLLFGGNIRSNLSKAEQMLLCLINFSN